MRTADRYIHTCSLTEARIAARGVFVIQSSPFERGDCGTGTQRSARIAGALWIDRSAANRLDIFV